MSRRVPYLEAVINIGPFIDDGIGIGGQGARSRPDSHGLKIMRERAEAFGGSVRVRPVPDRGTRVDVHIPIQNGTTLAR